MKGSTKQFKKRNAILEVLRSTDAHPSAEMVHEMLRKEHPDISLATVYRNLALFKSQGIIQSVGTVRGTERFDANTASHVHFVCTGCGTVTDLHGMTIPEELRTTASKEADAVVEQCHLTFHGRCRTCV